MDRTGGASSQAAPAGHDDHVLLFPKGLLGAYALTHLGLHGIRRDHRAAGTVEHVRLRRDARGADAIDQFRGHTLVREPRLGR